MSTEEEEDGELTSDELLENYFEQAERVLPEAGAEVGVGTTSERTSDRGRRGKHLRRRGKRRGQRR